MPIAMFPYDVQKSNYNVVYTIVALLLLPAHGSIPSHTEYVNLGSVSHYQDVAPVERLTWTI
jgi:hypothetical protein